MQKMTDDEVLALMRKHDDSTFNRARQQFSYAAGRIEQAAEQNASPVQIRRMEFEAVQRIAAELGVDPVKLRKDELWYSTPPHARERIDG